MERQRWRESVREASAVQLSLFTLNPSRTHSHCHPHPPKDASDPGPDEEGECISVTCITGWRAEYSHTHNPKHTCTCMCNAVLKHTFLILQAFSGCLPSFNLSVPGSFFFLAFSSRWWCWGCLAKHLWERLMKCQHSLQRGVRDYS